MQRFGDLPLAFETYAEDVRELVRSGRERLGLDTSAAAVKAALTCRALEDLVLARACEHGSERAWRKFHSLYERRLMGLAFKRGARGEEPQAVVAAVMSELALPAPRGRARTLLGTFDGSGSLWGWLAATVARRFARRAQRRRLPGSAAARPVEEAGAERPPWREQVGRESAARLEAGLQRAWSNLASEERCALVWKHAHGMRQRRIGELLGVREYQVSRWISRAVEKLKSAVVEVASTDEAVAWEHLRLKIGQHLARAALAEPLPPGEPHAAP